MVAHDGHTLWRRGYRDLGGQGVLDRRECRLGIPLGDRCTIEAGLFVTAGTKVSVLDEGGDTIETVSARTLAGGQTSYFGDIRAPVPCSA